jgi:hypothetical protein
MKAGDACENCKTGRLYYYGASSVANLSCGSCGWRPEALRGLKMPSRDAAWENSQERGITWEQFCREWDEYQAARVHNQVCNSR